MTTGRNGLAAWRGTTIATVALFMTGFTSLGGCVSAVDDTSAFGFASDKTKNVAQDVAEDNADAATQPTTQTAEGKAGRRRNPGGGR